MDLHRRRSVLVRMAEAGERLETVRISNDPEYLHQVMARAGGGAQSHIRVYWAADALAELGGTVPLANPLGVTAFSYSHGRPTCWPGWSCTDLLVLTVYLWYMALILAVAPALVLIGVLRSTPSARQRGCCWGCLGYSPSRSC